MVERARYMAGLVFLQLAHIDNMALPRFNGLLHILMFDRGYAR